MLSCNVSTCWMEKRCSLNFQSRRIFFATTISQLCWRKKEIASKSIDYSIVIILFVNHIISIALRRLQIFPREETSEPYFWHFRNPLRQFSEIWILQNCNSISFCNWLHKKMGTDLKVYQARQELSDCSHLIHLEVPFSARILDSSLFLKVKVLQGRKTHIISSLEWLATFNKCVSCDFCLVKVEIL